MPAAPNPLVLPAGLPEPQNDGACAHLPGTAVLPLETLGTDSATCRLALLGSDRPVLYVYPATGRTGCDPGPQWDGIPGAPGCTVQSLGFRDHLKGFQQLGFAVIGVRAQSTEDQCEFTARLAIPFVLVSDSTFRLAGSLRSQPLKLVGNDSTRGWYW
jgi:peroxiredoxin